MLLFILITLAVLCVIIIILLTRPEKIKTVDSPNTVAEKLEEEGEIYWDYLTKD